MRQDQSPGAPRSEQPPPFGAELRRLRTERGLSLAGLARLVHYSKGYLSKIENGTKPATPDLAERCEAALRSGGALTRLVLPGADEAPSPYPGLAAFTPGDARWFAGRDGAIAALLDRLAERIGSGSLALVAPSGAGKSSLLMAGLVPALRRGALLPDGASAWSIAVCTPTAHPLAALGRALESAPVGPATRLALVVDQFEETFTLCTDEHERRQFVRELCDLSAKGPIALVVLGIRADFCGRCLDHPELVPVLSHGLLALGPMTAAELREAITRPAAEAGLESEPGLVELLLRDLGVTAGQADSPDTAPPGVLPLLSHALRATWQGRSDGVLTVDGYLATGGIHGAVAESAEQVFTGLGPSARETARRLFLQLVQIGPEGEAFRRPVLLDQMPGQARDQAPDRARDAADPVGADARPVLDAFVRARLLTVDRDTVVVTHEALLRAWPRLQDWVQADRAGLLIRRQLAEAAAEWEREGRDSALAYRGTRLANADEWAQDPAHRAGLTDVQRDFLTAGHDLAEDARRAARRQARRERSLLVTLAGLLVLALVASTVAYRQRATAVAQERTALSRATAAESAGLAVGRPEASMLLADQAFSLEPTAEARSALLSTQSQPFAGRLLGHTGPVNAVALSPDAQVLASASSDGTVRLWSPAERRLTATLTGHNGPVRTVAFSPDGRTVASASSDGTIRLWDVTNRRPPIVLYGHVGAVRAVAFGPDGRSIASGGADHTVRLWDATTGAAVATFTGHTDEVLAVASAPDGRTIASGAGDRTVRLWDATTGAAVATLTGHSDQVLAVAVSSDGATVASGGADRTVRLWDVATGTATATLTGHSDDVNALAYTDGGATLASAGGDGTVRLWDVAGRRVTTTLNGHTDYVLGVATGRDGGLLASAGFDGSVVLWDLSTTGLALHPFAEIWHAVYSPDGRTIASADADHSVALWEVAGHRRLGSLAGHEGPVFGVAFSPDGSLLATAGADATVRLWDVPARRQLAVLTGHRGSVFAVAFSPDGRTVASAGEDRTVRLWSVPDRRAEATLTGHLDFVNGVAFSPDGRTLASGSDDLTVRLWDVGSRQPIGTLTGHTGAVRSVAFAPDGRTLASGGNDGAVRTWDTARRGPAAILLGHTGSVRAVAYSPDGRTMASAGSDGTVRTWEDGAATATLTGHTNAVWSVAFSPDGRVLASAGSDGTVRLWSRDPNARLAAICRLLGPLDPPRWERLLPGRPYRPSCQAD